MRRLSILPLALALLATACTQSGVAGQAGKVGEARGSSAVEPLQPFDCPPSRPPEAEPVQSSITDWVDFVKFSGIGFVNMNPRTPVLTEALVGERVAVVCQRPRPFEPASDGAAAFLAAGTELFSVRGYSPHFRIIARRDGELVLFEADSNPNATRGRDLIDLSQVAVRSIAVNDADDGLRTLARIDNRSTIKRLIELLQAAPVDQTQTHTRHDERRYFVEFELADGTTVNRSFWLDDGEYSRGLVLPGEFIDAISAAVGPNHTFTTGTTAPAVDTTVKSTFANVPK